MIVQVYEIQTEEEALAVATAGVDHPGILVGEGEFPREISVERTRRILEVVPRTSKKLVLTLSKDLNWISNVAEQLAPDILHLGTLMEWLNPGDVETLKKTFPRLQIMRSIPVTGWNAVELANSYDGVADFLLLDTHLDEDSQIGATGMVHDWEISKRIVESVRTPVILAGGLGPDNVRQAILKIAPAGVDSKTRTDIPGTHQKDLTLVRKFVENARNPRF